MAQSFTEGQWTETGASLEYANLTTLPVSTTKYSLQASLCTVSKNYVKCQVIQNLTFYFVQQVWAVKD